MMNKTKLVYFSKRYWKIIVITLLIFSISANIAWLNPRPSFCMKTLKKIPIMWQYNKDSSCEFLAAAYFPKQFKKSKTRINRPGYPLLVKSIGEMVGLIFSPFLKFGDVEEAMIGYIILKIFIYFIGAFLLYKLLLNWFDEKYAFFSIALVFLHPFSIKYISTFHTTELQFITPIIIIFLFLDLAKEYSTNKNIFYSLIIGFLMLSKQNYGIYLAILLFSLIIDKRFKPVFLSFIVHLIPLGLWLIFLRYYGLKYYNHEAQYYKQGVWLYQELIFKNPITIIQIVLSSFKNWLLALVGYFSISLLFAIFSFSIKEIRSIIKKKHIIFFLICLLLSWFQLLAAKRYKGYMTSDLSFFIFPLAAFSILYLLKKMKAEKYSVFVLIIYLAITIINFIHLPWIHPYKQKNLLDGKLGKVKINFVDKKYLE